MPKGSVRAGGMVHAIVTLSEAKGLYVAPDAILRLRLRMTRERALRMTRKRALRMTRGGATEK